MTAERMAQLNYDSLYAERGSKVCLSISSIMFFD